MSILSPVTRLVPCPRCGGNKLLIVTDQANHTITCRACHLNVTSTSRQETVSEWNKAEARSRVVYHRNPLKGIPEIPEVPAPLPAAPAPVKTRLEETAEMCQRFEQIKQLFMAGKPDSWRGFREDPEAVTLEKQLNARLGEISRSLPADYYRHPEVVLIHAAMTFPILGAAQTQGGQWTRRYCGD